MRNQINSNFWQIATTDSDGNVWGITADVSNVNISGGLNGQFLQTDGNGNLSWSNASGGTGNGVPGGSNSQVQFNNSGSFGGIPTMTYNTSTGNITFTASTVALGSVTNLRITGGTPGQILSTDGVGNLSWISVGSAIYSNANVANYLPTYGGNLRGSNITVLGTATTNNFTATGRVNLGANGNVSITGGTVGQLLTSDGAGGLYWSTGSGGGGGGNITNVTYGVENVTLQPLPFGVYQFDVATSAVKYVTQNATGNITLNFRGNSTATFNSLLNAGQSITCSYVMTTGSTAYGVTGVTIDGVNQTIRWAGGTPIASGNSTTTYTFTLVKVTGTPTYTVLGSATRYF